MTSRQWREIWAVTFLSSVLLAFCFLNASHVVGKLVALPFSQAGTWFVPAHWGFVVLALLFWASAPKLPERYTHPAPPINVWVTFLFPIAISFTYGWFLRPGPSLVFAGVPSEKLWHLALVPVGEELLFRGWFYSLLNHRYQGKMATATNPFPIAGWFSSLAFSLWHLQNLGTYSSGFVAFQLGYTFLAGMWLALVRWRSGSIAPCILGHAAINLATSLPPFP